MADVMSWWPWILHKYGRLNRRRLAAPQTLNNTRFYTWAALVLVLIHFLITRAPYGTFAHACVPAVRGVIFNSSSCCRKVQRWETTRVRWKWEMRLDHFFPLHGFLISSEIAPVVLRIPPCRLRQGAPSLSPPVWWSSVNSPYCCLMEMGTQTDEQPLPGSALQVFINRDAEALMALIFQAKRRLWLAPARRSCQRRGFPSELQPKSRQAAVSMSHLVCWVWTVPPCGAHLCRHDEGLRFEDVEGKLNSTRIFTLNQTTEEWKEKF